jgi:hypothetical protein
MGEGSGPFRGNAQIAQNSSKNSFYTNPKNKKLGEIKRKS